MKNNIYIILFIFGFLFISCESWLDVKPQKLTEEEELFSREQGFKEALTGVYIKMASTDQYATTLTYGFMDILAQRYRFSNSSLNYQDPDYYNFNSTLNESRMNGIWKNLYNDIANLNNLLTWIEKNASVLISPNYYEIIKGEALGLRAFLHFDLLRMYGPGYDPGKPQDRNNQLSIVYRTEFNRDVLNASTFSEAGELIIKDLLEAESLLKETDPLDFSFPVVYPGENSKDGFLVYRYKRMNYYAVQALLARVYLYIGNKTKAAEYANKVIESQQFKLVLDNNQDRVYSTELIFSLHVHKFVDTIEKDFNGRASYVINDYDFFKEQMNVDADGTNDIRVRPGSGFEYENGVRVCQKFNQTGLWYSTTGTMPLIRLPEMYYILAECATDYTTSYNYLNMVRGARGSGRVTYDTEEEKMEQIGIEYRKEFYGEGQLWYFYKRTGAKTFLHLPAEVGQLSPDQYKFRTPDNESIFGGTVN
ncbi:RagB/SusD family nutrient uptake outer membrane protein [Bacteroides sp. 224]|uniref:RagB/SusD family nutrient uptake outer membrane protein n=1 Tax=Bacteroides sp. 224 TaxID=2302936 RepID=UPI0013D4A047|nr:RagB/SusD family nutrient uptake outer membrane protein [Bacteroides sp. 224]NDV65410.1 RagB/SusD family nutrient uptake outer membrane protein [Bacteroides sp. 224]